ncbi:MAG: hypothetical protein ABJO01_16405 [Parasphingorhabdus sp.]|uniref:hypothetical protein n=1 Tax=Parasphingorhabdus sp. TaxID=2709688 RepID=UPI0032982F4B
MNVFEWSALGLILFGLVVPFWAIVVISAKGSRQSKSFGPSARYFAYSKVMDTLMAELKDGKTNRAPIVVASVRELKKYSEYRDISVLFLEEVSVNGNRKFDRVLEQELKTVEAEFLKVTND